MQKPESCIIFPISSSFRSPFYAEILSGNVNGSRTKNPLRSHYYTVESPVGRHRSSSRLTSFYSKIIGKICCVLCSRLGSNNTHANFPWTMWYWKPPNEFARVELMTHTRVESRGFLPGKPRFQPLLLSKGLLIIPPTQERETKNPRILKLFPRQAAAEQWRTRTNSILHFCLNEGDFISWSKRMSVGLCQNIRDGRDWRPARFARRLPLILSAHQGQIDVIWLARESLLLHQCPIPFVFVWGFNGMTFESTQY